MIITTVNSYLNDIMRFYLDNLFNKFYGRMLFIVFYVTYMFNQNRRSWDKIFLLGEYKLEICTCPGLPKACTRQIKDNFLMDRADEKNKWARPIKKKLSGSTGRYKSLKGSNQADKIGTISVRQWTWLGQG